MFIAVCVIFAVWSIVRDGERKPVDTATLLGVPIGVTGLVIAVVALRRPVEDGGVGLAPGHDESARTIQHAAKPGLLTRPS
ncbi:hypothetical protein [Streptomyces sp. NPDC088731]|uniref:hypothetical protein n=1 Tax=Streptomyces sp. NPDC088731 TaxID=3365878 RepID=UPI003830A10C